MTGKVQPYAGHSFTGLCQWVHLEPGDSLCRVWDRESGLTNGFDATDWNPNFKDESDSSAGRFDPLPSDADAEGFIYGTQSGAGEKVALLETFRSLMFRDPVRSGRNVIPRAERDRRAIRRFRVAEPIALVNLNIQLGRECFRMDEEVLYIHDRPATRSWSGAVRKFVPEAAGIAYNSTRESLDTGLRSFILWKDRAPRPKFVTIEEIPLSSDRGRQMVYDALADYDIVWA